MTPEQRRARGLRAQAVMRDSAVVEAFDEAEAELHELWARARWRWIRERIHAELMGLQRVRRRLGLMAGQAPRD